MRTKISDSSSFKETKLGDSSLEDTKVPYAPFKDFPVKETTISDSSSFEEGIFESSSTPPFFPSHRFVICILMLLAAYFLHSNNSAMSTAVICMVNESLTVDKWEGKTVVATCKVNTSPFNSTEKVEREFAISGEMNWSPAQQAMLVSARYYGSCITIAFTGMVVDRFGPDIVLAVAFTLQCVTTLIIPLLSYASYNLLLSSRVLAGVIESFQITATHCLAARWFPDGEKTLAASIYTTGSQWAAGLAALFASSLCSSTLMGGWPSIFYVFGGTSTVFTLILIVFGSQGPSKNRWVSHRERAYLEDKIRIRMKGGKRTTPLSTLLLAPPVHSIILCMFAFAFSSSIAYAYLPLFLREELGLPIQTIGWYTLAPFLAQIVGKAIVGPLINYYTQKGSISLTNATKMAQAMGSFGAAVTLILLAWLPTCEHPSIALYTLIIYGFIYAGGTCGFYVSMLSMSPENTATLSIFLTIASLSASVVCTMVVNALTALGVSYKWTLVFGSASLFQLLSGLHFLVYGTTEVQTW